MATRKQSVFRLLTTLLILLVLSSIYSNALINIIKYAQSTAPNSISSKDVVRIFPSELPTAPSYSSPVRFRDIFDPSKIPNIPIGPDNITDKDKYFIYRCDERTMRVCGGWADRIKGAMFAYMVANLTGRVFKMEILTDSCDIQHFIVPNQVNWSLPNSFHQRVQPGPNVSKLNMVDNVRFIHRLNHDFLVLPHMKSQYLYFKVNQEPLRNVANLIHYQSQLAWMKNLVYPEVFNTVYRRLFKPSTYISNKVKFFLRENLQSNSKLVCAHLRMGLNAATHHADAKMFGNNKNLPSVWAFLQTMAEQDDVQIFLTSDNAQTIDEAKQLNFSEKIFFSSGKILHIDRLNVPKTERCDGYEKIIFEQLVLMHCDVLVITKNSGISRVAAYVRGTDDDLYCFSKSIELIPCIRTDL